MSTAIKTKAKTKKTTKPKAQKPASINAAPVHIIGKPAEIEPAEHAAAQEAPEAAMISAEAPDAGYGRCTESSDWENRGRS